MQWRSDWILWACLLKDVKCSCLVTRFLTGLLWATAVERAPELFGSQGGPLSLESSCSFSTSCSHADELQPLHSFCLQFALSSSSFCQIKVSFMVDQELDIKSFMMSLWQVT